MKEFFQAMAKLKAESIEPGQARKALAQLGDIPPFLRALLVADGTVTMALEAYFDDEIKIQTLQQEAQTLPLDLPVLNMRAGDEGYFRRVRIVGARDGQCYAEGSSLLNKSVIGGSLFAQLVDEHIGIGVILRNFAKGSFREVLGLQRGSLIAGFDVYRSYRVSLGGIPAILINEEFPIEIYRQNAG